MGGLPLFLFAASTAVSFIGQRKAGKAAELDSQRSAKQMEIDRILGEAQAAQAMADRYEAYEDAMSQSNAMFMGGMEAAQEAFEASQRKILVSDVKTISTMSKLQSGQASIASRLEIERGKNARRASFFNAIGTLGQAAVNYQMFKT